MRVLKFAALRFCKTAKHQIDHGEMNERFAGTSQNLVVFGKSSVAIDPSEGSLDNPTTWQQLESFDIIGAQDDIENEVKVQRDPIEEFSAITAIDRRCGGFSCTTPTRIATEVLRHHDPARRRR